MNLISKVLLGALVICVFAVLWYLGTQKNKGSGGCCGDCASCAAKCERENKE